MTDKKLYKQAQRYTDGSSNERERGGEGEIKRTEEIQKKEERATERN